MSASSCLSLPFPAPAYPPLSSTKLVFLFIFSVFFSILSVYAGYGIARKTTEKSISKDKIGRYMIPFSTTLKLLFKISPPIFAEILSTSVRAGVGEELVFRFLLMRVILMERCKLPFWVALQISACCFSMAHMMNSPLTKEGQIQESPQIFFTYISGLFLGFLYYYTNNLPFVMMVHTTLDGISMLVSFIQNQYAITISEKSEKSQ